MSIPSPDRAWAEGRDPERALAGLVRLSRDLLAMDVAMLTEVKDGRETALEVAGQWPGIDADVLVGASLSIEDTFCRRLLEGRIENAIPDVAADERVSDLALARNLGVGAWVGVPIRPDDVRVYVLCCLACEAQPEVGEREVRILRGLAQSAEIHL